jgi:uncharacterized protein YabE (DUF348 family)
MNFIKQNGQRLAIVFAVIGALLVFLSFSLFPESVYAQIWLEGAADPFIVKVDSPLVANWLGKAGIRLFPSDSIRISGVAIPHDFSMPSTETNRRVLYKPAVPVRLVVDGESRAFSSGADTLLEALWEQGIILKQADQLSLPSDTPLDRALTVTLRRSQPITVVADGREIQALSAAESVGGALAQAGLSLQGLDFSEPAEDMPIPDDKSIRVVRVREEIISEQSAIPYSSERVSDPDLTVGEERVLQVGANGVQSSIIRIRFEDGEEVDREVISQVVSQVPVIERIAYGGNIIEQSIGDLNYYYALDVRVTCYGWTGNTTSSGEYPSYGSIAVKLPWYSILKGTQIYVPNYGTGTVMDVCPGCTGQPWIDVYTDECYTDPFTYNTTVYFLSPAPPAFTGELP